MNVLEIQIIDPRVMPIFQAMELRGWILIEPTLVAVTDGGNEIADMTDEEFRIHLAELKEALT